MDMRMLMKQAQQMQAKMAKAQEELANKEVSAEVGGGQVKVVMTGKHRLKSIEIAPEALDPDDIEFLQDLIIAAVNEGANKVDELVEKDMGSVAGGMNIPGMPGMG
jgi:DNA-binding YbaB/EbfC family protein